MKRVLTLFEWLIFAALIVLVLLVSSSLLPTKDILSSYVVASGSMEPILKTGAIIFTTKVDPKTIKKGEIVTFAEPTNPKNVIVHRVIAVQNNGGISFRTKGDHNNAVDNWTVTPSEIKGKTLFSIPYLGYAVEWFKTPLGFGIGIGVPALILIFLQAKKIKEGINEEVEKRTKEAISKRELSDSAKVGLVVLLLLGCGFALPTAKSYAYFSANATVSGITLVVGSSSPTITPTITPTPSQNDCNITIANNGAGSTNTATCSSSTTTEIQQENNTTVTNITNVSTNTGQNTVSANTSSGVAVQSGSSRVTTTSTTSTNTNTIQTQRQQ
jgi:signal peptidase